jgi:hypothetical protein
MDHSANRLEGALGGHGWFCLLVIRQLQLDMVDLQVD